MCQAPCYRASTPERLSALAYSLCGSLCLGGGVSGMVYPTPATDTILILWTVGETVFQREFDAKSTGPSSSYTLGSSSSVLRHFRRFRYLFSRLQSDGLRVTDSEVKRGYRGEVYIWSTASGVLLKAWNAHYRAVSLARMQDTDRIDLQ